MNDGSVSLVSTIDIYQLSVYWCIITVIFVSKNSREFGEQWKGGVPIEVIPFASTPVIRKISETLGGEPVLRMAQRKAVSVIDDNDKFVLL